jgi:hypothetical protein
MRVSRLEQSGGAGEKTLLVGGSRDTSGEEAQRVASRAKLS